VPLTGDVDYIKLIQMGLQYEFAKYFQRIVWLRKKQYAAALVRAQGDP
jgi:hypothetical protein